MEPYLVVLMGSALTAITALLGWVASMCVKLSQEVSSIQAWRTSATEEHNYLRNRVDDLASIR